MIVCGQTKSGAKVHRGDHGQSACGVRVVRAVRVRIDSDFCGTCFGCGPEIARSLVTFFRNGDLP